MNITKEIANWFKDEPEDIQNALGYAHRAFLNDLIGIEIHPDPDLHGLLIRESGEQYTEYALYLLQNENWAATECIPDIWKGIDIDDEKYLAKDVLLMRAIGVIVAHHKRRYPERYPSIIEIDDGYRRKWAHTYMDCFNTSEDFLDIEQEKCHE